MDDNEITINNQNENVIEKLSKRKRTRKRANIKPPESRSDDNNSSDNIRKNNTSAAATISLSTIAANIIIADDHTHNMHGTDMFDMFGQSISYHELLNKWLLSAYDLVEFQTQMKNTTSFFWFTMPWQIRSVIGSKCQTLKNIQAMYPKLQFQLQADRPNDGWKLSSRHIGYLRIVGSELDRKSVFEYLNGWLTDVRNRQIQSIDQICNAFIDDIVSLNENLIKTSVVMFDAYHEISKICWNLPSFEFLIYCDGYSNDYESNVRLIFLPLPWQHYLIDSNVYAKMHDGRTLFQDLQKCCSNRLTIIGVHVPTIDSNDDAICTCKWEFPDEDSNKLPCKDTDKSDYKKTEKSDYKDTSCLRVCMHIAIYSWSKYERQWATQWLNRKMYEFWHSQMDLISKVFPDIMQEVTYLYELQE